MPIASPRRLAALALLAALPALAACHDRETITSSIAPTPANWRDRHPIKLADAPRVLDAFVEGPDGFSRRTRRDLDAFLHEHDRSGNGPLVVQVPSGTKNPAGVRVALDVVRRATGGRVVVRSYAPADPSVASPLRLSFVKLQAKVATQCGLWPHDLGPGGWDGKFENGEYYNLGCAAQSNFASQVADANDLVRPLGETPPDTMRRMGNIDKLRKAEDPQTRWLAPRFDGGVASVVSQ